MRRLQMYTALLAVLLSLTAPTLSYAGLDVDLGISIGTPVAETPPPLPVYVVPPPPVEDVVWMPGYWAWDDAYGEYYWVPGTWVQPPAVNLVWTPGYWGWSNNSFYWHEGYWGSHVGFYGGVVYGGGYDGHGFHGGAWRDNHFVVDRRYVNVRNVTNVTRIVSYNGGPGGVDAAPSARQAQFAHEQHRPPTPNQIAHVRSFGVEHTSFYNNNHGQPPMAATPRPEQLQHRQLQPAAARQPAAVPQPIAPHVEAPRPVQAPHMRQPHSQGMQPHQEGGRPEGGHFEGGHPGGDEHSGGRPEGGEHGGDGHP